MRFAVRWRQISKWREQPLCTGGDFISDVYDRITITYIAAIRLQYADLRKMSGAWGVIEIARSHAINDERMHAAFEAALPTAIA